MTRHPSTRRQLSLARRVPATIVRAVSAAVVLSGTALLSSAQAAVVERFDADPLTGQSQNVFFTEGDVAARFTFLPDEGSHFPADRDGTLRVLYDTTVPTARISTPMGEVLTLNADFEFGAILTIRSEGYFADPNGFSQIAFGVWNAGTTGLNRTSFPSDSFDLVEFDYFPNVTSFGGPFLSPSVFGGNIGGNAFFNFAFASAEVALPFDVPLLVQCHYAAATQRLNVRLNRHTKALTFERITGATVSVDLSRIDPTFLTNVAGIAGYFEGYPSIHAVVDYDLLYVGPLPGPWSVTNPRIRPGR
jgi:hypothetical protein